MACIKAKKPQAHRTPTVEPLEARSVLAYLAPLGSGGLEAVAQIGIASDTESDAIPPPPSPLDDPPAWGVTDEAIANLDSEDGVGRARAFYSWGQTPNSVTNTTGVGLISIAEVMSFKSSVGEQPPPAPTATAAITNTPTTFRIAPHEGEPFGLYVRINLSSQYLMTGSSGLATQSSQVHYEVSYTDTIGISQTLLSGSAKELREESTSFLARVGDTFSVSTRLNAQVTGTRPGNFDASSHRLDVRIRLTNSEADIQIDEFQRANDGGFFYQLRNEGNGLGDGGPLYPQNSKVAAFWAAGPSAQDIIPGRRPVYEEVLDTPEEKNPGVYPESGALHVPLDRLDLSDAPAEATHLVLVVDPDNAVAELNEANNDASIEFLPPVVPRPDIVVTSIRRSDPDGGVDFTVEVRDSDLVVDADVGLYWARGQTVNDIMSEAIAPQTVRLRGTYGPFHVTPDQLGDVPAGATHLIAGADRFNFFNESNEANNLMSIVVQEGGTPVAGKADLIPQRFAYFRRADELGDTRGPLPINLPFGAEIQVANIGTSAAGPFSISIYASIDGVIQRDSDFIIRVIDVIRLSPGEEFAISVDGLLLPTSFTSSTFGNVSIGVFVDNEDSVRELSEENNSNQGIGIDRSTVVLYDPVYTMSTFIPDGFRSYRSLITDLRRRGYSNISANPEVNLFNNGYFAARYFPGFQDWHRALDARRFAAGIRSVFDNSVRPADAFRAQAVIVSSRIHRIFPRQFLVVYQGEPEIGLGEPNPFYALWGFFSDRAWFNYVRDWHRRF